MVRQIFFVAVMLSAWSTNSLCLFADSPQPPWLVGQFNQELSRKFVGEGLPSNNVLEVWLTDQGAVRALTSAGAVEREGDRWVSREELVAEAGKAEPELEELLGSEIDSSVEWLDDSRIVGAENGLHRIGSESPQQLFPEDAKRRWAPTNVCVALAPDGKLWFGSKQGAGCYDGESWQLFTGAEGLPYEQISCVACGPEGSVWFGTERGLIRYRDGEWFYRQGLRWLPNDEVHDIAVDGQGNAWVATAGGVANIYFVPLNLAAKAEYYEREIDQHHRRTDYEYVIDGRTSEPGKKDSIELHSSDNDGLWTSMYGAGECFAYAATGAAESKSRAQRAFRALAFLSEVCRGSEHEPPQGFIARSILEVEGNADPNATSYSIEQQLKAKERDGLWRVYEPRWPKSADGKYYWKSDTSSDELDGHYFFYPLYYDLVAETEEEREAVRKIVRDNIDHLLKHDFSMHDHAGRTRWSIYGPDDLNQDPEWFNERGLKSLSMLSYLNVAYHMTGDEKYRQVSAELRSKHAYHTNIMWPKYQFGLGSGNQSDDEMAFMCYYNLIKYEPDDSLRKMYLASFANSWRQEEPEMNPFFNVCFAAVASGESFTSVWGEFDLSPWPTWLEDSVETLKRFPIDRFDWMHTNSHRADIVRFSDHTADVFDNSVESVGYRVNGKVIAVDERYFNHWNHSPWQLDSGYDGRTLGSGAVFTLPYYMALYHRFIENEEPMPVPAELDSN